MGSLTILGTHLVIGRVLQRFRINYSYVKPLAQVNGRIDGWTNGRRDEKTCG